jgi:hypothetical protein
LKLTVAAVLAVGVAVLLVGCRDSSLPSAPSDLTSGVVVFEHANFLGRSAHLTTEVANLADFDGPCEHEFNTSTSSQVFTSTIRNWDECMSSVKVSAGWRATIYRDSNFKGQSVDLTSDAANLQLVAGTCSHDGLNDCVSSIRVARQ